jgi:hypothetical protein
MKKKRRIPPSRGKLRSPGNIVGGLSDLSPSRGGLTAADLQQFLPQLSDLQLAGVGSDVIKLLSEQLETIARIREAEAELALARGALARVQAQIIAAGYQSRV